MAIYIKFEGVDGPCEASGHETWIEMQSWGWMVSRDTSGGNQPGMVSGVPRFDGLEYSADIGSSSASLLNFMINGEHFEEVKIECIKSVGGQATPEPWYKITLSHVVVTSIQQSVSENSGMESVTLSFRKHSLEISDQGLDGKMTASKDSEYDFTTQTA